MMRLFKKKREYPRYHVQSGTFIVIGMDKKVQVIDISKGGLAFAYDGSKEDLEKSGVLSFLTESQHLDNVFYDTVSTVQLGKEFRRTGVKFKWLGVLQQVDLDTFIRDKKLFEK